jgi:hypothetical protein
MKYVTHYFFILLTVLVTACVKENQTSARAISQFGYGDSIFYLKAADYVISPANNRAGTYSAFPENLNIDADNGKINVTLKGKDGKNNQTGLRYRIVFTPTEGKQDTTYIILAGITYQDKIYNVSGKETTALPIYNASIATQVPAGTFTSSNKKLAINAATGEIDLEKTVKNSFFHNDPRDADWEVVTINYKTNDQSSAANNSLDVVVYYYSSVDNIPSNVSAAMRAHQGQLLGISPLAIPQTNAPIDDDIKNIVSASRPRPPCIIIIGRI